MRSHEIQRREKNSCGKMTQRKKLDSQTELLSYILFRCTSQQNATASKEQPDETEKQAHFQAQKGTLKGAGPCGFHYNYC